MIDSIPALLAAVEQLPPAAQRSARLRVEEAIEQPAPAARAALGLLALDLAAAAARPGTVIDLRDPVHLPASA